MIRRISIWMVLLGWCMGAPEFAPAHSMYQAAVLLDFRGGNVEAELQLPLERLQTALGRPLSRDGIEQERASISEYLLRSFSASLADGRTFQTEGIDAPHWAVIESAPYVVAHFRLAPPPGANADVFDLRCAFLADRVPSQVVLVSSRTDWRTSTFANDPQLLGVVRGGELTVSVDRRNGSWWRGFGSVFQLGMRHIAEGTDHLLFLLALLLPAPLVAMRGRWADRAGVRRCLTQIGRVVTAFTVGHSITLAAGALGVAHASARLIETLIAVSILVSAVHAIRPIFPGKEAAIAGCFGLVHGLAFATTLADLGLARWERVASIFGFNLGIEAMQLIVVAATMPALILLSRTSLYPSLRTIGGAFAGTAAIGWIAQRAGNFANPMDGVVQILAQRAVWIALALTLLGVWARMSAPAAQNGKTAGDELI